MISDTMRELNANELEGVSGGGGGVGVGKFMAGPVMTFTPLTGTYRPFSDALLGISAHSLHGRTRAPARCDCNTLVVNVYQLGKPNYLERMAHNDDDTRAEC